jgi:hypothetical protein
MSAGQAAGRAELAGSAAGNGVRPHRDGTVGALLHGLAIVDMFSQDRPVIEIAEVGRDGSVTASVSVSGPASRMREPAVIATTAAAAEIRATAREVSTRLGAPADIPGWD